jgi:hypothetical protein
MGPLQFVTDKFRDLTLQEPESRRITRSGTDHLPPAPVQFSLVSKAQLRHRISELGKMGLDPEGDKVDHILATPAAPTDPIYLSPSKSDSEGGREVYMVENGEDLLNKTVEEIQRETDIELARAARLAKEAKRGKKHNGMQDDLGVLEDEPRDGPPARRQHPKFNSRHPADRDRLWNQ